MNRFKRLPIWPAFVACAAAFYFCCFYSFSKSFSCGENDMIDCSEYWSSHPWLSALVWTLELGTPGLAALVLARRSIVFLSVWLGFFATWTVYFTASNPGIDGQNGCELCDFAMAAMAVVSWLSLIPAAMIGVALADRGPK